MNYEPFLQEIITRTEQCIREEEGIFLVDVKVKPVNNLKIFVDGDQGVNIDVLTKLNRKLYRELEENRIFPGNDFSLEVSSPGLEEPLKLHRQYVKNTGRLVKVITHDGRILEGKLKAVSSHEIELEQSVRKGGQGKKSNETITCIVPFDQVKETTVQVHF